MEGPPVKFHIDPNANPIKLNKPAPVPLYGQEQVWEELGNMAHVNDLPEQYPYSIPPRLTSANEEALELACLV